MRNIFLSLFAAIACLCMCAQSTPTKVKSLVVKTNDGKLTRFNLTDIKELCFEDGTTSVGRVLNLTPDFFTVTGLEEGKSLTTGSTATLTLKAGGILSQFETYHFEHIHLHINDMVIMPTVPDDYTPAESIEIPFTVPEGELDIVVCYSGQQQLIDNGYTMTLKSHLNVRLYGVSPDAHYKYFDAYLLADEAYTITDAEYKVGNGDWVSVGSVNGCSLTQADNGVDNLYKIAIRPDYQNVTGNITLRVSGEQHTRHTISWNNATDRNLNLEKCTLPTRAIDGEMVYAEIYIDDSRYLRSVSASNGTEVETTGNNKAKLLRFMMPDNDVTVTFDFADRVPLSYTTSEHITEAKFYDAPDTYYGVPCEIGVPGSEVYLFVNVEDGYKPSKVITADGNSFDFTYYGPNHFNLPYYCMTRIPADAASLSAKVECEKAWSVSCAQEVEFEEGKIYAAGETVKFSMRVPSGQRIDKVTAITASGAQVPLTLELPYGTFIMPAEDVTVTVTYADLNDESKVSVIAIYDEDQYGVNSSTNYDWDFAEGFQIDKGSTFFLSVTDYYGMDFYVGVKVGDSVTIYHATEDEDSGEYTFGRAIVATGDVTIKVGYNESSVGF